MLLTRERESGRERERGREGGGEEEAVDNRCREPLERGEGGEGGMKIDRRNRECLFARLTVKERTGENERGREGGRGEADNRCRGTPLERR